MEKITFLKMNMNHDNVKLASRNEKFEKIAISISMYVTVKKYMFDMGYKVATVLKKK